MKYGKNFDEIEKQLISDAQEEIICSDWCVWEKLNWTPVEFRSVDEWETKRYNKVELNGVLFDVGKSLCYTLIEFAKNYHNVFNMEWEADTSTSPMFYNSYGMSVPYPSSANFGRITFQTTFILELSSKNLQKTFLDFYGKGTRFYRNRSKDFAL